MDMKKNSDKKRASDAAKALRTLGITVSALNRSVDRSKNDIKNHINKAMDMLTIIVGELKGRKTLNKKKIRKLSKSLLEIVESIFSSIDEVPQALEKCYKKAACLLKK